MPKIDLNLLRVFETLYETRSVTRAADRLGLTQSAVSHALGRLRDGIGDPLFVRQPDGLQPTARAMEIAPGVRKGLEQLLDALTLAPFDPSNAVRRFRINTGVYFSTLLVPDLVAHLREIAPRVTLAIQAPGPDLLSSLDHGTTDIALGAFGKVPPRLMREQLFREELVWIARANSPLVADPAAVETLPPGRRLRVALGRPFPGHGSYSWDNGLERLMVASVAGDTANPPNISENYSVHDALTAIATVAQTDLVATVPRQLALRSPLAGAIAILQADTKASMIDMDMLWPRRLANDNGLRWLCSIIRKCLEDTV